MAEDYVRPPLLAREPPSQQRRRWRFRALLIVAVLAVIVAVVLVVRALVGSGEGNPGIGTGQAAPHAAVRIVPDR